MLTLALVAMVGCKTPAEKLAAERKKQLATLRLYLETNPDPNSGRSHQISVLRSSPIVLSVEKAPFMNESHVESAKVTDNMGGFVLFLQFNQQGRWLLEQYSAANPKHRFAIRSQFGYGTNHQDRWLGAPLILGRIGSGVLAFTPDATREEAEDIALGLNNVAGHEPKKDADQIEDLKKFGGEK